jgi:arylsulfatase A-like enzyme
MKFFRYSKIVFLALICFLLLRGCSQTNDRFADSNREQKPNIIVIFADDLDFDEINFYDTHPDRSLHDLPTFTGAKNHGYPHKFGPNYSYDAGYNHISGWKTPNLDYLSQNGATFKRFYITSPVCTPSRYSLLTGKYASRSKALRKSALNNPVMRNNLAVGFNTPLDDEILIPKMLKSFGYKTGMVGKWHNFSNPTLANANLKPDDNPREPEVIEKLEKAYDAGVSKLLETSGFDYVAALYGDNVNGLRLPRELVKSHGHNLEWISAGAEKFIDENKNDPFFLYMSLPAPHGWLGGIGPTDDARYTPRGILPEIPKSGIPSRESIVTQIGRDDPAAMTLWMDYAIGAIHNKLVEHEISENSIIFFTSDHQNRGKQSVYEGSRVPAFIYWPKGIKEGFVIDGISANIDIAPTLLEIAGKGEMTSYTVDGDSLVPLLTKSKDRIRDDLLLEIGASKAIVTEDWKYISNRVPDVIKKQMIAEKSLPRRQRKYGWAAEWLHPVSYSFQNFNSINYRTHAYFPDYFDDDQLYDLNDDPYEQDNLFYDEEYQEIKTELTQNLAKLLTETDQVFGGFE